MTRLVKARITSSLHLFMMTATGILLRALTASSMAMEEKVFFLISQQAMGSHCVQG